MSQFRTFRMTVTVGRLYRFFNFLKFSLYANIGMTPGLAYLILMYLLIRKQKFSFCQLEPFIKDLSSNFIRNDPGWSQVCTVLHKYCSNKVQQEYKCLVVTFYHYSTRRSQSIMLLIVERELCRQLQKNIHHLSINSIVPYFQKQLPLSIHLSTYQVHNF